MYFCYNVGWKKRGKTALEQKCIQMQRPCSNALQRKEGILQMTKEDF